MNDAHDPSPAPRSKLRPLGMFNVTAVSATLIAMLAMRPLPEARAEVEPPATDETSEAETEANQPTTSALAEPETEAESAAAASPAKVEPEAIAERRPLRVVGLGWELLAPGLIANDGLRPGEDSEFRRAGLELEFAVAYTPDELEARLARGGGVEDGADVAVLPLPTFVASYEQLRALSPEVFFVLGWSRGRDALAAEDPELLTGHHPRGEIELVGLPGQPATMLSLFALDEIGVDARRIELVPPTREDAEDVELRAIERSLGSPVDALGHAVDARRLVLTSADAPRLIPMVAVAPAGFVHANANELARFAGIWLEGADRFATDVPDAARRIAREKGAPEAVALLEMMSYVAFADLADGARLAGLSGRGAVSLEVLFHRSWELWREVGVLSTPAPEYAPLDNSIIARVALGEGAPVVLASEGPRRDGERLVLVHTIPSGTTLDEQALVDELGFLAGTFERAEVELRVRRDKQASRRIVDEAVERFGLDPDHLRVGPRLRGREAARIRVLVP
jgi:hypothetical protein